MDVRGCISKCHIFLLREQVLKNIWFTWFDSAAPMRTLKTYRMIEPTLDGPIFANQYGVDICGTVNVGDEVYAEI